MNTSTTPPQEDQTGQTGQTASGREPAPPTRSRSLTRPRHDRMLAGVASGIAGYVGVDALLVRIAFAILAIVGGVGIPLYLACWLLIPDEGTTQSIATDFTSSMHEWRN
jgi:phage shock protein PspC (stress-responsive transcriptional regulator)